MINKVNFTTSFGSTFIPKEEFNKNMFTYADAMNKDFYFKHQISDSLTIEDMRNRMIETRKTNAEINMPIKKPVLMNLVRDKFSIFIGENRENDKKAFEIIKGLFPEAKYIDDAPVETPTTDKYIAADEKHLREVRDAMEFFNDLYEGS